MVVPIAHIESQIADAADGGNQTAVAEANGKGMILLNFVGPPTLTQPVAK